MGLLLAGFGIVALVTLGTTLNVIAFLFKLNHSRRRFGVRVREGKSSWQLPARCSP